VHGFSVGGFSVGSLRGFLRGITGCREIFFHGTEMIPNQPRFGHGVYSHCSDASHERIHFVENHATMSR
jgi:hypothetical protein